MIPDWSVPFTLTSPYGELEINQVIPGFGTYRMNQSLCSAAVKVRSTKTDVPQSDGSILHHRFFTGVEAHAAIQLWDGDAIACDATAQLMFDTLMLHLRALVNAGDNQGRISWVPDGNLERMFDDIRLLAYPTVGLSQANLGYEIQFDFDTQYPYAQDLNQSGGTPTLLAAGVPQDLVNVGSASYFPVFKVGPSTTFTLRNNTTGLEINYDGNRPGAMAIPGGSYGEIDTFRNTMYLNGNSTNLKPGIEVTTSDFWELGPGTNNVECDVATTVLWASAWA